jgi:hypothetical protein
VITVNASNPDSPEGFRQDFRKVLSQFLAGKHTLDSLNSPAAAEEFAPFRAKAKKLGLDMGVEFKNAIQYLNDQGMA